MSKNFGGGKTETGKTVRAHAKQNTHPDKVSYPGTVASLKKHDLEKNSSILYKGLIRLEGEKLTSGRRCVVCVCVCGRGGGGVRYDERV